MATYSIKWLRNFFGTKFFPITHMRAVRDNNNNDLETLSDNQEKVVSTALNDLNDRVVTLEDKVDDIYAVLLELIKK